MSDTNIGYSQKLEWRVRASLKLSNRGTKRHYSFYPSHASQQNLRSSQICISIIPFHRHPLVLSLLSGSSPVFDTLEFAISPRYYPLIYVLPLVPSTPQPSCSVCSKLVICHMSGTITFLSFLTGYSYLLSV